MPSTTLFAFAIIDGNPDDDLVDLLGDVADAGVADSEWEWLAWEDPKGRLFGVVRGSLAARAAFLESEVVSRQIRLSIAHQHSADNRCDWISPTNAQDGRDALEKWIADPGFEPVPVEVSSRAPVAAPSTSTSPTPTLRMRDRSAVRETSPAVKRDEAPSERAPEYARKDRSPDPAEERRPRRGGSAQQRPPQRDKAAANPVMQAFGAAMSKRGDKDGQTFSMYRRDDDAVVEEASDD